MHFSLITLFLLPLLTLANPVGHRAAMKYEPDIYEAIHQAEYQLALTLDTKNWAALPDSMTSDIIYDNSALGPGKGGRSVGYAAVLAATKAAFGDSLVSHLVTNALITIESPTRAHVITYLTYSKWDPKALTDGDKTYRVYEKCDDIFVLESGLWKLKYSIVTNQAPRFEQPYFGKSV